MQFSIFIFDTCEEFDYFGYWIWDTGYRLDMYICWLNVRLQSTCLLTMKMIFLLLGGHTKPPDASSGGASNFYAGWLQDGLPNLWRAETNINILYQVVTFLIKVTTVVGLRCVV